MCFESWLDYLYYYKQSTYLLSNSKLPQAKLLEKVLVKNLILNFFLDYRIFVKNHTCIFPVGSLQKTFQFIFWKKNPCFSNLYSYKIWPYNHEKYRSHSNRTFYSISHSTNDAINVGQVQSLYSHRNITIYCDTFWAVSRLSVQ